MSPRSAAVAALALMARGISAIGPYSDGTTTLTGEPQLVGSATSNGMLLYSFNYCTTVQTTACAVTVSTGASPSPEYSTLSTLVGGSTAVVTVAVPISYPSAPGGSRETAAPSAANTDDSSAHWTADPVITPSASPDVSIPATDGQTSPTVVVVVIPTTDEFGSPTLLTSAAAAASSFTDGIVTDLSSTSTLPPPPPPPSLTYASSSYATSSSSGHSSSSRATSSTSSSTTRGASNATISSTPEVSSATSAGHAAPSKTGAAASLNIIPAIALGAATLVAAILLI